MIQTEVVDPRVIGDGDILVEENESSSNNDNAILYDTFQCLAVGLFKLCYLRYLLMIVCHSCYYSWFEYGYICPYAWGCGAEMQKIDRATLKNNSCRIEKRKRGVLTIYFFS